MRKLRYKIHATFDQKNSPRKQAPDKLQRPSPVSGPLRNARIEIQIHNGFSSLVEAINQYEVCLHIANNDDHVRVRAHIRINFRYQAHENI